MQLPLKHPKTKLKSAEYDANLSVVSGFHVYFIDKSKGLSRNTWDVLEKMGLITKQKKPGHVWKDGGTPKNWEFQSGNPSISPMKM